MQSHIHTNVPRADFLVEAADLQRDSPPIHRLAGIRHSVMCPCNWRIWANAVSVGDSAFDDNGGSVSFPINLPPSFTLYFWSKPTAYGKQSGRSGAHNNVILGGEVYLTNGFRSGFTPAGLFSFWTTQSGGTLTLNDTTDVPTGTWVQYAITYSSGIGTLYRNGSLVTSASGTYVPGTTGMGLDSGISGGIDQFYGLVDQVRLYNYALSGSAITALYNSDVGI